jgi:hypothetical protein
MNLELVGREHQTRPPKLPTRGRLGDIIWFHDYVTEAKPANRPPVPVDGHHSGWCTCVQDNTGVWLCQVGFDLPGIPGAAGFDRGGRIHSGGLIDFEAAPPYENPIWGGTGDYRGRQGYVTLDELNRPTRLKWTVNLLP